MLKPNLYIALRGLAMGMAEVVPGVSGGTIAFITGIYERLINAIKAVSTLPLGVLKREGIKGLWNYIDGNFLLALILGMAAGILVGVLGISYLLDNYPPIIWGFFFGLIIASVLYIGRQVKKWGLREIAFLISGIIVAFYITIISPAEGSENLIFVFLSGAVAVSALILPGISGSFILLLLGMYSLVLHTAKDVLSNQTPHSILILGIFMVGCLVGLFLFSNVLSWTFKKFRYPTLAILTGFMVGSLNRIWPWRNATSWLDKDTGEHVSAPDLTRMDDFRLLTETNVQPAMYDGDPMVVGVVISFAAGIGLVYFFSRFDLENEEPTNG